MGWIGSGGLILEKLGEVKEYAKNILYEKKCKVKMVDRNATGHAQLMPYNFG